MSEQATNATFTLDQNGQVITLPTTGTISNGQFQPVTGTVTQTSIPASIPAPTPPAAPAPGQYPQTKVWTQEEVDAERERVRKEEKEKLYPDLERYKARAAQADAFEADRKKAEEDQAARELAAVQAAKDEELSAKELLKQERAAREADRAQWQEELGRRDAILAQERRYGDLALYRTQAIAANSDHILPELAEFITGGSEEEINAAVERAIAASQSVLANVANAQDAGLRSIPTVGANSPAMGPESWVGGQKTLTAEQIRDMPMGDWAKMRGQLGIRDGQSRGMF